MKRNSIVVKLWTGIVIMTLVILFIGITFQTRFLHTFYYQEEANQLERDGMKLSKAIADNRYNFAVPYQSVIRRPYDIIIVTDNKARITYVAGTSEYKIGNPFRQRHIPQILEGKSIRENNTIIQNLDSLMVGVPIRATVNIQESKQRNEDENGFGPYKKREIVGAVYIITPLERLETTINAIKLQFYYIFAVSIIIASLLSFLLSQSFSKPIRQINDAALEIARGNYNTTISLKSSEEIKALGETMNNLALQLSRVEKIRREFIANVSHELRTPLSYLKGYTEILLDGLAETEEDRQKYLRIIMEETERLKNMVNEILQLSQIEAGGTQLKLSPFSIEALVKRTIDKILPIAAKRNISIKFNNLSEDVLLCLADESCIKQVLINLVNNAVKHSYDYGNILINAYRQNDRIYISLRDFGEGISEVDLPFIWDRFYTVDKAKSEHSTGLGLAIVKNIINAHGTEITVNSIKDEGTEFCFWLHSYNDGGDDGEFAAAQD